MSRETLDMMDKNIEYLKKVRSSSTSSSETDFMGNITRGAEVVKSAYLIIDTIGSFIEYLTTRKEERNVKGKNRRKH